MSRTPQSPALRSQNYNGRLTCVLEDRVGAWRSSPGERESRLGGRGRLPQTGAETKPRAARVKHDEDS